MIKNKKNIVSILVIFMIMLFSIGCSSTGEELSFQGLIEEMEQLETYSSQGEISIDIKALPENLLKNIDFDLLMVLDAINNHSIIYELTEDSHTGHSAFSLFVKDNLNEEKIPLLSVLSNNDTYYIKVDDIKKFVGRFINDNLVQQEIDAVFALLFSDAHYIHLTEEEIIDLYIEFLELSDDMEAELFRHMMSNAFDNEYIQQNQNEMLELFNPFIQQAADIYSELKMDLVNQEENKFTISISILDLLDLAENFTDYSISHADEVGALVKEFVPVYFEYIKNEMYDDSMMGMYLNEDEMEMLSIEFDMMLEEINNTIDYVVEDVNANKEHYASMLETTIEELRGEVQKLAENTRLNIIMEKVDSNTYETTIDLNIDIQLSTEKIEFTFNMKEITNVLDSFEIAVPTQNVMEGKIFSDRIKNLMEMR